jgi:hypothetical protein
MVSFQQIADALDMALDRGDQEALRGTLAAVDSQYPEGTELPPAEAGRLAALLIDAGAALQLPAPIQRGQSLYEKEWNRLEPIYGAAQLHYNLGNGYQALYEIECSRPSWRFNLEGVESCLKAKSSYWRALARVHSPELTPRLLTNLANALDCSGRVVDALHYYDNALSILPLFGMASCNRGQALLYLNQISGTYSVKLLYEIYKSFEVAMNCKSLDPYARQLSEMQATKIAEVLRKNGYDTHEDPHSVLQNQQEVSSHDSYWLWCLEHSLVLSEHALYCRCVGARRDDLSILTSGDAKLSGAMVPKMELLLNRMKSEYCLSRALLYQSVAPERTPQWDLVPFEGTFTELLDDEEVGIESEFLRTSFRLCFGILDRIARGICDLFKLAGQQENVYFHKFWRPTGKADDQRWVALNQMSNAGLVALYGLARDMSEQKDGEWSHLRRYRNLFEHSLCLVRKDTAPEDLPPWFDGEPLPSVSRRQMRADAADMLRFTRAAIFYFALLVRAESLDGENEERGHAITFHKKPVGKD